MPRVVVLNIRWTTIRIVTDLLTIVMSIRSWIWIKNPYEESGSARGDLGGGVLYLEEPPEGGACFSDDKPPEEVLECVDPDL